VRSVRMGKTSPAGDKTCKQRCLCLFETCAVYPLDARYGAVRRPTKNVCGSHLRLREPWGTAISTDRYGCRAEIEVPLPVDSERSHCCGLFYPSSAQNERVLAAKKCIEG